MTPDYIYIILISQAGKYHIKIPIKLYYLNSQAVNYLFIFMNSYDSEYNHNTVTIVITRK